MSEISNGGNMPAPPQKKSSGGLISVLLLLILIGLGGYTFYLHRDKQKTTQQLEEQKTQMIAELGELRDDYNVALETSGKTSKELEEAKARITMYIDSLKTAKADVAALWKYRKQVQVLKEERKKLLAVNDSLRKHNKLLVEQRDSTVIALNEKKVWLDSLEQKNTELSKTVEEGAVLVLRKLDVHGIKTNFSGKYVDTDKARASEKIRVCFTVAVNRIAKEGERNFYVQVTNPLNVTLGKNETVSVGEKTVNYSMVSSFMYEKKAVDICEYITRVSKDKRFEDGTYIIKVYDEELRELGTSELYLR